MAANETGPGGALVPIICLLVGGVVIGGLVLMRKSNDPLHPDPRDIQFNHQANDNVPVQQRSSLDSLRQQQLPPPPAPVRHGAASQPGEP